MMMIKMYEEFYIATKMLCNFKVKVAQVEVFKFCHKRKAE